jgi:uncharacterized protein with HEPN domain
MSNDEASREWRFYIEDMIAFCERVQSFTHGINRADFIADLMRYDATVRNIELIGEAATHVPNSVRQANASIPWRMVIATRNQLIRAADVTPSWRQTTKYGVTQTMGATSGSNQRCAYSPNLKSQLPFLAQHRLVTHRPSRAQHLHDFHQAHPLCEGVYIAAMGLKRQTRFAH